MAGLSTMAMTRGAALLMLVTITKLMSWAPAACLSPPPPTCSAWLVVSYPTDLPQLPRIPGLLHTGDVLQWLAGNSSEHLDIIAQYWQLLAQPENPLSSDFGYTHEEMERFGAPVGASVFKSLQTTAQKGIPIRIIQHSGEYPDYDQESAQLAAGMPNVQNRTLLLGEWWGSGIVHAKVWISDRKDLYIGSANNDWKSLTQVKELGIYIINCPEVVEKVEMYFENLWTLTNLNASQLTTTIWDNQFQIDRKVPCWSHFVSPHLRCKSPLIEASETPGVLGYPYIMNPSSIKLKLDAPGCNFTGGAGTAYFSFSPPELSFENYQTDEQGWVDTILSVGFKGTVRINTMDWLGRSQYSHTTVYWPALSSAISKVIFSKHASVKLLLALWTHNIPGTDDYLHALDYTNTLCSASGSSCYGSVEIKYFKIPGFNSTGPKILNGESTGNMYPGYTRVTHGKYVVSDSRAHIGTSNLVWDYFYTTAGVSFGLYNHAIVSQLQAVFDADWQSPYAVPFQLKSKSFSGY